MYVLVAIVVAVIVIKFVRKNQYRKLETDILNELGIPYWNAVHYIDEYVTVKSRQSLEKYDDIKFLRNMMVDFHKQKL